jgi:quercetin dioxygenase-like cupin family protein
MHATLTRTIFGLSALILVACSDRGTETVTDSTPSAEPVTAAEPMRKPDAGESVRIDPTVADPDHYTVELENDAVRVLRIRYGAGEESVMHHHPDSAAIFLTDADGLMTLPDGSTMEFSVPAGAATFNPGGDHQPKNTSDAAWEVVEVELKPRDAGGSDSGGPDPTVVDADHYTTEFENDDVRIVRIRYGAGEESVMHYHPDSVAVFVTDHLVAMTMPDGTTEEIPADAGDVMFIPGGQHLPRNVADSAWELVLIELKQ